MQRISRIAVVAILVALVATLVVACAPAKNPQDEARHANQMYMSQVNSIMTELGGNLDAFNDAVARDDLVGMRTQSTSACKVLDQLTALEPPEVLADVHEKYAQGADKLRQALEGYVVLYSDVKVAADSEASLDSKAYSKRLAEIQTLYDEGVAALSEADELAASR